jgi:tetratricopeptide (TPR) repeat protein
MARYGLERYEVPQHAYGAMPMTYSELEEYIPGLENMGQEETSKLLWAQALYHQQDYQGALSMCTEALEDDQDSATTHYFIAFIHTQLEQYELALKYCTRALDLEPCLVDALILRGRLETREGSVDSALGYYQQALALDPGNSMLLHLVGDLHHQANQATEAMESYEKATSINSSQYASLLRLAQLQLDCGQFTKAREALNGVKRIKTTADSLLLEGQVLESEGQYREAIDSYYQSIALAPHAIDAHLRAGFLLLRLHQPLLAIRQFRISLSLDVNSLEAKHGMTECQKYLGVYRGPL